VSADQESIPAEGAPLPVLAPRAVSYAGLRRAGIPVGQAARRVGAAVRSGLRNPLVTAPASAAAVAVATEVGRWLLQQAAARPMAPGRLPGATTRLTETWVVVRTLEIRRRP
jgi:hypothetical protein